MNELKAKLIEEKLLFLRFCWEQYMKFYTVFLTVNIVAVGLVVEHVDSRMDRLPIAAVFIVHNIIAAITPLKLRSMSNFARKELSNAVTSGNPESEMAVFVRNLEVLPARFAGWAGIANSISQFGFALLWIILVIFGHES